MFRVRDETDIADLEDGEAVNVYVCGLGLLWLWPVSVNRPRRCSEPRERCRKSLSQLWLRRFKI